MAAMAAVHSPLLFAEGVRKSPPLSTPISLQPGLATKWMRGENSSRRKFGCCPFQVREVSACPSVAATSWKLYCTAAEGSAAGAGAGAAAAAGNNRNAAGAAAAAGTNATDKSSASGELLQQQRSGFIFGPGRPGAWDSGGVGRSVVRRYQQAGEEARWCMWYEGWQAKGDGGEEEQKERAKGETGENVGGSDLNREGKLEAAEASGGGEKGGGGGGPSCVGLALSSNGLHWTRGEVRVETDARGIGGAGMVLSPTDNGNWWTFDTRHVRPSDVLVMASQKVRASGGVFWMYYEGHCFEEATSEELGWPDALANAYLHTHTRPGAASAREEEAGPSGRVVVSRSRVGLALSHDGRNWAAIEGQHHSHALFETGSPGEWDAAFVAAPSVVFHSAGDIRLYYHSADAAGGRFAVGMARSRDGLKWVKWGKVFEGSHGGKAGSTSSSISGSSSGSVTCVDADVMGAMAPHVFPMAVVAGGLSASELAAELGEAGEPPLSLEGYVMLYEGVRESGRRSICWAYSEDGISGWQFRGLLLEPSRGEGKRGEEEGEAGEGYGIAGEEGGGGGGGAAWDAMSVTSPCLVALSGVGDSTATEGNTRSSVSLRLYYIGVDWDGQQRIGVAESCSRSGGGEGLFVFRRRSGLPRLEEQELEL